jgi:hypothetical protein
MWASFLEQRLLKKAGMSKFHRNINYRINLLRRDQIIPGLGWSIFVVETIPLPFSPHFVIFGDYVMYYVGCAVGKTRCKLVLWLPITNKSILQGNDIIE